MYIKDKNNSVKKNEIVGRSVTCRVNMYVKAPNDFIFYLLTTPRLFKSVHYFRRYGGTYVGMSMLHIDC